MNDFLDGDPWHALRRFTQARIALGRAGNSLPTAPLLAFNLAHAQARDAVHHPLDTRALHEALNAQGFESIDVHSAAPDRATYLRRPDLGRRLSDESREALAPSSGCRQPASVTDAEAKPGVDLVFVVADGLSAFAATKQAAPLLALVRPKLVDWHIAPIVVARQARVALGDEIGERLNARFVAVLIGERPGLSSPDSLGIYLTYEPRVGRTDAERNCISNVRPEGLNHAAAAHKLHYLLTEARRLSLTGVGLRDGSDALAAALDEPATTSGTSPHRMPPT